MEEAARKRRERLLALKQKAPVASVPSPATAPQTKFVREKRSRSPESSSMMEMDDTPAQSSLPTLEERAEDIRQDLAQQVEELRTAEVDIFTLAPKKVDWDLKRDIEGKLAKLERQTQRSIADLIRARLRSDGGANQENLAAAVQNQRMENEAEIDSD